MQDMETVQSMLLMITDLPQFNLNGCIQLGDPRLEVQRLCVGVAHVHRELGAMPLLAQLHMVANVVAEFTELSATIVIQTKLES